jgi:hypothetical protein
VSIEECSQSTTDSNVKVEELGRKAVFKNPGNVSHNKIRIDGCVIKNGERADFAVEKLQVGTILIEFKGKDIEHAADQIIRTAVHWRNALKRKEAIAGLIVGTQYPRASTSLQKKQADFAKRFKSPLHCVTRNCVYEFEKVLSFKGPL